MLFNMLYTFSLFPSVFITCSHFSFLHFNPLNRPNLLLWHCDPTDVSSSCTSCFTMHLICLSVSLSLSSYPSILGRNASLATTLSISLSHMHTHKNNNTHVFVPACKIPGNTQSVAACITVQYQNAVNDEYEVSGNHQNNTSLN